MPELAAAASLILAYIGIADIGQNPLPLPGEQGEGRAGATKRGDGENPAAPPPLIPGGAMDAGLSGPSFSGRGRAEARPQRGATARGGEERHAPVDSRVADRDRNEARPLVRLHAHQDAALAIALGVGDGFTH